MSLGVLRFINLAQWEALLREKPRLCGGISDPRRSCSGRSRHKESLKLRRFSLQFLIGDVLPYASCPIAELAEAIARTCLAARW
jgi:hypothetical protein